MRAIMAIVLAGISLLLSGCGATRPSGAPVQAGQHRSTAAAQSNTANVGSIRGLAELIARRIRSADHARIPPDSMIKYQDREYYATVSNATLAHSFTAFATVTRDITVQPSSSARVDVVGYSAPRFMTPSERVRWRAAGKPPLPQVPVTGQTFSISAGSFSFIPQGIPLTYQQASSLPGSPKAISGEIAAHVRPFAGVHPPVTVMMMQLGFLLATAPLARDARSAAWSVLVSLPGLRLCGQGRDLAGRHGQRICASTRTEEIEVLVDTGTGSVLAVSQRILKASPWFPGVPEGSIVLLDTFIPGS